jgi:hypothetical protein
LGFVILLAEYDEPSLAAKKKRQSGALTKPTFTPKNRVWGFENFPSGRPGVDPQLSWENTTGSVQYTYQTASGLAEWLSRDPLAEAVGPNLYQYAYEDPIRYKDPTGAIVGVDDLAIVGIAAVATLGILIYEAIENPIVPWNAAAQKPPPGPQPKPKNCPSGTVPVDQAKLPPGVKPHDIKDDVGAGATDWVGVAPNGDVITSDAEGNAVINGPYCGNKSK